MTKNYFLKHFTVKFKEILKTNLVCLLLIGSVKNKDENYFSDIDLVALIKYFDFEQIKRVRKLIRQTNKIVDLSVLCLEEISSNPDNFRIGSHGCHHLELVLKKARVLSGINVLNKISSPSKKAIETSVFEKIVEYAWWARRTFIESNRKLSIEDNYKVNNRLIKMIRDLLFLLESFDIMSTVKETIDRFMKICPDLLLPEEKEALLNLISFKLSKEKTFDMSDDYLETRLSIINKIYRYSIKTYENIQK